MHNNLTGSIAFCKINYFACSYLFITCIHKLYITSIIDNPLPTVYELLSQKFETYLCTVKCNTCIGTNKGALCHRN